MEETLRTRRVAELLRKEISQIITLVVKDPKVRNVVITGVNVTKDLASARIFFTTYNKDDLSIVQKGLERSSEFIHREMIKSLRMKKVPKLEFVIDSTDVEANKIDALLGLLEKESNERGD